MAQTSQEIRRAWDNAHYKRYLVNIRVDTDEKELIDYIEKRKQNGEGTKEIFVDIISRVVEEEKRAKE